MKKIGIFDKIKGKKEKKEGGGTKGQEGKASSKKSKSPVPVAKTFSQSELL